MKGGFVMSQFGLSPEEIDEILKKNIDGHIKIDHVFVRTAITEAITENNKKILESIQELINSK